MSDVDLEDGDDGSGEEEPWWAERGYELERNPTVSSAGMYGPVAVAVDAPWSMPLAQREVRQRQTLTGRWGRET